MTQSLSSLKGALSNPVLAANTYFAATKRALGRNTADPAAWETGQQEALQVRINEVLGWAN